MIVIPPSNARDVHEDRTRLVIPLIDPLRQPAFGEKPRGRGVFLKNFDTQRERHLQPLVDGIGASEQETRFN